MSVTGIPGQGGACGIPSPTCALAFFWRRHSRGLVGARMDRPGEVGGHIALEAMLSMLDFQASRWLMAGEVPPQRQ